MKFSTISLILLGVAQQTLAQKSPLPLSFLDKNGDGIITKEEAEEFFDNHADGTILVEDHLKEDSTKRTRRVRGSNENPIEHIGVGERALAPQVELVRDRYATRLPAAARVPLLAALFAVLEAVSVAVGDGVRIMLNKRRSGRMRGHQKIVLCLSRCYGRKERSTGIRRSTLAILVGCAVRV